MSKLSKWWTVKNLADLADVAAKFAALIVALAAVQFFFLKAEPSVSVVFGQAVDARRVAAAYQQAGDVAPQVVEATIADVKELPPSKVDTFNEGTFDAPNGPFLCQLDVLVPTIEAIEGKGACKNKKLRINNLSRAELLFFRSDLANFLYRDPRSWVMRTGQPTPSDFSEIFPTVVLTPKQAVFAWTTIRSALETVADVKIANGGKGTATSVSVSTPEGFAPEFPAGDLSISPGHSAARTFVAPLGAVITPETTSEFTVSWSNGPGKLDPFITYGLGIVFLLLVVAAAANDILKGTDASASP
jgi:hypothetical protein